MAWKIPTPIKEPRLVNVLSMPAATPCLSPGDAFIIRLLLGDKNKPREIPVNT